MSLTTIETPFTEAEIEKEAERLLVKLMHVECDSRHSWNIETCRSIAPLTLEINALKEDKEAVTHHFGAFFWNHFRTEVNCFSNGFPFSSSAARNPPLSFLYD